MQITMNKFSTISSNFICPPCVDVINRLLIARSESFSYEQYLLELFQIECEARRQNRIARNLRSSKLPPSKMFANFDKKRLPAMVAAHLNVLADGSFLNKPLRKCIGLRQSRQRQNPPVMRHRSSADRTGQTGCFYWLQPAVPKGILR